MHLLACHRVGELEPVGVKQLPWRGELFVGALGTIHGIAENGGAYMFEVHADLVGAAG